MAVKQIQLYDASAKEVKQVKMTRSAIEEVENDIFVLRVCVALLGNEVVQLFWSFFSKWQVTKVRAATFFDHKLDYFEFDWRKLLSTHQ